MRLLWLLGLAGAKPHVVLLFADDYGWGNFGRHRRGPATTEAERQAQAEAYTPELDALADEGILLDRHYAYKICAPSRSGLQSGRLPVHVNAKNTGPTVMNASDPVSGWAGIPRNMTGLATKLKEAGYRTHAVGKWDAGMATPEHTPKGRGYESWIGYFQHANDYWRKNGKLESIGEIDNCLDSFTDLSMHNSSYCGGVRDAKSLSDACRNDPESDPACYEEHIFKTRALEVINAHDASEPLFLFYAFHLVHTPLEVPQAYLAKIDARVAAAGLPPISSDNRRKYAAMTLYLDTAAGEVVAALKQRGMWDDTLFIFASDNGGPIYEPGAANNHPLRGGKFSDWEGGVRTNSFVSGGFVPPHRRNTTFEGVVSIADWYGTICELAGADPTDHAAAAANPWLRSQGLPELPPVDARAQWAFLLNDTNARPEPLHLSDQAVLVWPHKLVVGPQKYSSWQGHVFPNCSTVTGLKKGDGPDFTDLKVFNLPVNLSLNATKEAEITWTHDCGAGCLYDVAADPTEHDDLAADPKYHALLASLQGTLRDLNKALFTPLRGDMTVEACDTAIDQGGFYGPFAHTEGYYSPPPKRTPAQRAKDTALRLKLRALNKRIVVEGVKAVAKEISPWVNHEIEKFRPLDQCLHNDTIQERILV